MNGTRQSKRFQGGRAVILGLALGALATIYAATGILDQMNQKIVQSMEASIGLASHHIGLLVPLVVIGLLLTSKRQEWQ